MFTSKYQTFTLEYKPLSASFTTRGRQSHTMHCVALYSVPLKRGYIQSSSVPLFLVSVEVLRGFTEERSKNMSRDRAWSLLSIVCVEKKKKSLLHCLSRKLSLRKTMLSVKKKKV